MDIPLSWTEFKQIVLVNKVLCPQYLDKGYGYFIWGIEYCAVYNCAIDKTDPRNADQIEFEDNYKASANHSLEAHDNEGRAFLRAESRPLNCTTYFSAAGDSENNIGDGKSLAWDFSNNDDIVTAPSGFKRKRIDYQFIDTIYLKEGTLYFHNSLKGSYVDQYIICPTGYYYYKNDGTIAQATEDTVIAHYVNRHPIQGTCPMGDELNTETCSSAIPSYYKFRLEITVPDTDSTSNGCAEAEIYRVRTVILA